MKYIFANYATGKHILKIGGDALEVIEGVADVDTYNPAQLALAEVYGGKPLATHELSQRQQPKAAGAILTPKRALASAIQRFNNQVKSMAKWGSG